MSKLSASLRQVWRDAPFGRLLAALKDCKVVSHSGNLDPNVVPEFFLAGTG